MKNIVKNLASIFALAVLFTACKKDEIPPIGTPESKLDGINDTWTLSKVYQYDTKVANSDLKQFDISDYFIVGTAPVISFNSATKTYTYNPGDAPNLLGANGTWRFDDDLFPAAIIANDQTTGEERVWGLLGPTRPVDTELRIAVQRGCASDGTYYYLLVFTRQ